MTSVAHRDTRILNFIASLALSNLEKTETAHEVDLRLSEHM